MVGAQGGIEVSAGYVCGVPRSVMRVIKEQPEPERWCFGERKRRPGKHVLMAPDPKWVEETHAYGWAEPYWHYECAGCGEDRRAGFGYTMEYAE